MLVFSDTAKIKDIILFLTMSMSKAIIDIDIRLEYAVSKITFIYFQTDYLSILLNADIFYCHYYYRLYAQNIANQSCLN